MDWTQTFTIIGVFVALFIYMMNRMDSNQQQMVEAFKQIEERFNSFDNRMTKIEAEMAATNQRISDMKTDMNQRLASIEGYLIPRKIFHFEEPIHKQEDKSMKN